MTPPSSGVWKPWRGRVIRELLEEWVALALSPSFDARSRTYIGGWDSSLRILAMFDMPDHLEKMVKVGVSYALEAAHESVDRCSYDCLRVLLKFGNIELDSGLDGDDEWTLVLRAVINDHPNCLRMGPGKEEEEEGSGLRSPPPLSVCL